MVEKLNRYFSEHLKVRERVLICCPRDSREGVLLADAAAAHECQPVFWDSDPRWSGLLRLAFTGRYRVIAGPPQLLLGLSKLSKQRGTPLYIRNAILTGSCAEWVRESIERGLDCETITVDAGTDIQTMPQDLRDLEDQLLRWSSVLDCRLLKGTYGLEMQIISFPGKKLPQFPTCAKLDIQPFDAERHIPFYLAYDPKNPGIYMENH